MIRTHELASYLTRFGLILGLALGVVITTSTSSFAGYEPRGGEPPTGGSTTSGMRL